jgi:uncharacterized membrane protein
MLLALQEQVPHRLMEVNVDGDRKLREVFGDAIPVIEAGPYQLKAPFNPTDIEITLRAAAQRERELESLEQTSYPVDKTGVVSWTRADSFSSWLSRHYVWLLNTLVIVYLGLPFLAPALMAIGLNAPASAIYRMYGLVCHQFAFRSWFLFGEQPVYPRQAAVFDGLLSYGQATGLDESDQWMARQFVGNPVIGYKVALCQRDVAIYGGILLFGLVFSLTGRRIKSLPWYWWVVIGILPIAMDGLSQLLSQPPLGFFPYRESTPFLRTLTGLAFGFTTAWFGYPLVEETMADMRRYLEGKRKRAINA